MADTQYDVPPKVQRLYKEKQKIRDKIRQYFIARITSPYPDFTLPIDPAIERYHAMITYRAEHYKMNARNGWLAFVGLFLPLVGLTYLFNYNINKKEQLYRSGAISYKNRMWKLMI